MTRTSCPRALSALGSAPATSARPPVLAKGVHSDATNKIFKLLPIVARPLRYMPLPSLTSSVSIPYLHLPVRKPPSHGSCRPPSIDTTPYPPCPPVPCASWRGRDSRPDRN